MRKAPFAVLAAALCSGSVHAQIPSEYRVAVVLVRFADAPQPAWGRTEIASTMGRVREQYAQYSYGRLRIVAEVYGWYGVDAAAEGTCPKEAMRRLGESALARDAGARLTEFDALMFVTAGIDCGLTEGTASIGGTPARVWVYRGNNPRLIGHELAHALGFPHSKSRACSPSGCTEHEYGDPYDPAGSGAGTHHFNAAQKEAQGWLGAPGTPSLREIRGPGVYWIDAYEHAGDEDSVRALKVQTPLADVLGRNVFYYVESRGAGGRGRVLLHTASAGGGRPLSVHLVDLAPHTAMFDTVLDPGQSFTDRVAGLTFTTLSSSAEGSLVRVEFDRPPAEHTRHLAGARVPD